MAATTALVAAQPAAAADGSVERARFVVRPEVIAPDLAPFTATLNEPGNGARLSPDSGGFEPENFRNMFLTTGTAADRIIAPLSTLSNFDTFRTGAFDGAEVEILRIENGAFRSVRRDRIAPGGTQLGSWTPVTRKTALAPDRTRFDFAWDTWNRSGVPYYFTVRAVDRQGRLSDPAPAVAAVKPAKVPKGDKTDNAQTGPQTEIKLTGQPAGNLAAPQNLRVEVTRDGIARLDWDPVPGAAGYAVYRSDDPPDQHRGVFYALEGKGAEIRAGDLVILRDQFRAFDRDSVLRNRVWDTGQAQRLVGNPLIRKRWPDPTGGADWRLVPHEPGAEIPGGGQSYLQVDLARNQKLKLEYYNHAGTEGNWYPVLEPGRRYRFEVWLRGTALAPVRFGLAGPYGPGSAMKIAPVMTRVTPEWTRFTATFSVPQVATEKTSGKVELVLSGPGRIDVDNFRFYRDDAPFLSLLPEDADRLAASGMGVLRLQETGLGGRSSYDLEELTNPAGASNIEAGTTLFQLLALARQAGKDPWIQILPHLGREEWLGLAEFLAAPFDPATDDPKALPWAAKRVAQGQAAPWTDQFDTIRFEIGNETWNPIYAPWTFKPMKDAATGVSYTTGEVYGLYQEYVLGILHDSPYWPQLAGKLVPVLAGWSNNRYGADAARHSPSTAELTIAPYIGGWDQNEGPVVPTPQGFSSVLTYVLQAGEPYARKLAAEAAKINQGRESPLRIGTYEAGPGYALNGLNRAKVTREQAIQQELVMKSAAAGTATLDNFLAFASAGFTVQNYYRYYAGEYWASHARWYRGGQNYPSWDWLALFNREAGGDLLAVETLETPVIDVPKYRRRNPVKDGPLLAAYATRATGPAGDRLSLILISRRVPGYPDPADDGHTAVTVDLPISGADRLTRYSMSGRYDATNTDAAEAVLESRDLPVPPSLPRLEVPDLAPGEAVMLVFDGVR